MNLTPLRRYDVRHKAVVNIMGNGRFHACRAWVLCAVLFSLAAFAQDGLPVVMPAGLYVDPDPAAKSFAVPQDLRADALRKLDTALRQQPKAPVLLTRRAYLLKDEGDDAGAARDFGNALLYAEPGSATERNVLWSIAWARYDGGEYDDALGAWRRAVTAHGGKPFWQAYTFALLYGSAGKQDAALAWYDAAVAGDPRWGTEAGFAEKTKYWRPVQRQRMQVVFKAWVGSSARALAQPAAVPASKVPDPRIASGPVEGQGIGAWTADWWRWALAQPIEPYLDPDGRFCDMGQAGPVWFLAGTDGNFKPKRVCTVPEGKHLLVPVINMVYFQRRDRQASTCTELQAAVAVNNDHLVSAAVLLDDKPVGDIRAYRIRSDGCFRLDPADPASPLAAADGYWLMIKPLPSGRHTLRVGANYGSPGKAAHGGMHQDFEYDLDVGGKTLISDRMHARGAPAAAP